MKWRCYDNHATPAETLRRDEDNQADVHEQPLRRACYFCQLGTPKSSTYHIEGRSDKPKVLEQRHAKVVTASVQSSCPAGAFSAVRYFPMALRMSPGQRTFCQGRIEVNEKWPDPS